MSPLASANLIAWAIQAGVIVAVAAPLPRLLGVWSPGVRAAIWRTVLVASLLLPLIQPWAVRPAPAPAAATMETAAPVATEAGGATPAELRAPGRAIISVPARWSSPVVLAGVLSAGVLLRLGWLGLGLFTLGRLRRSARPFEPRPASIERAVSLAGTDAEFLVSDTCTRPVTCGIRRPIVIVPRHFEGFPEGEQTAIACHELLHVARADWTWNIADEVTRAVFWFHPAIWWLIDQIQLAREQLVDREVVRRLGTKQPYLQALLRIARPAHRLVLTPASLFLKRAHLTQRVALLVKEVSMSKARLAVAVLIMAVVVFAVGRLTVSAFPLQRAGEPQPIVNAVETSAPTPQQQSRPGPPPQQVVVPDWHPDARRIGGDIKLPTKTVDAPAVYPDVAKAARVQGVVICEILVGPDGRVQDTRVRRSIPLLDQAALDAVRQWQFRPALLNGNPTPVVFTVTVRFALPMPGSPSQAETATEWHPEVLRVGGDVKPPSKLVDAKPVYPELAKAARVQGVVICEILVGTDGKVEDVRVLRSIPLLDQAALDAVRQWEFQPTLQNGNPIPVVFVVTVNFVLPPSDAPAPKTRSDWPPVAVRIGVDIKPPTKLVDVRPVYPEVAQQARVQGVVICDILVGPDGKVKDARVLRSIPLLDQSALDAVRQWEFSPTLRNGEPTTVVFTVTVNFMLE